MPALQIRDVPEDVYQSLVTLAKKEHRSINQQALYLLKSTMMPQDATVLPDEVNVKMRDFDMTRRRKFTVEKLRERHRTCGERKWPKDLPTPTEMVREDRDSR